jgi:Tfp pilus assembly protein PilX
MRNISKKVKSQKSKVKSQDKNDFGLSTRHFRPSTFSGGYTLLFAMIVASIVLALGVSLLTISRKEFVLSSSATQSTNAFYAADSGIGCAEYWDGINGNNEFATDTSPAAITCSYADANANPQVTRAVVLTSATGNYPNEIEPTYTFTFYTPFSTDGTSNQSCAYVTVDKYYAPNLVVSDPTYRYTTITSRGYNIGWNKNAAPPDCSSPSPKKVERAIQVTY